MRASKFVRFFASSSRNRSTNVQISGLNRVIILTNDILKHIILSGIPNECVSTHLYFFDIKANPYVRDSQSGSTVNKITNAIEIGAKLDEYFASFGGNSR